MPVTIVRADSVQGAARLAAEGARFVAGGTLAIRSINAGETPAGRIVLSDGLGLDRIEVADGRAEIGAAVTMAQIARRPELAFLKPVATSIGGPAVRAMATVGGNLFAPHPYGDFTVAMLALGAEILAQDSERSETIDLEAFLTARENAPGRIVRRVSFALPPPGSFRFAKVVRKRPHGASVLSIAGCLPIADGSVNGARIAYGAMAPIPMRARAVERALEGWPLDAQAISAAAAVAAGGCAPLSDPQASEWYRLTVLPVHLTRLLQRNS